MAEVLALLADLQAMGVELETDGTRLRWRPANLVPSALVERMRAHRAELLEALQPPAAILRTLRRCGQGHVLDSRGRCWRCCDRACSGCGRPTGSAFIELCTACGLAS